MYNIETKERFLLESVPEHRSQVRYQSLFNITESVESKYKKDLYELNTEEMQEAVNSLMGMRSRANASTLGYIKRYINWCEKNGIPNVTGSINDVKIDGTIGIRQRLVKSPLHLQLCLDRVFEKEEEDTIDILYRCFFWMAYAGIRESDTVSIKVSDVDLLSRKIIYNEIEYPIYEEGFKAFKKCVELDYFDKKHPRYTTPLRRYRVKGDELLRGCGGKNNIPTIERVISFKCNQKFDKENQQLTYKRVRISGIYYRAYQKEQVGEPISFMRDADIDLQARKARLKPGEELNKQTLISKTYDYKRDYELWKKIL